VLLFIARDHATARAIATLKPSALPPPDTVMVTVGEPPHELRHTNRH
jgi:hypothetical protein